MEAPLATTPGGYSKNNMAIFTRAQSNPQFPPNLPNPNFQYKDLGQTLDSVYNNYLASRQDARQQGQLELQGRQDSRQQGLYDQQMQEAANKIQMQQNIERLRYGGTITGQNPDYGAEQINASLRPIPVQNANIPSMLVNPNLSRVPPPYQNPTNISEQADMTQVQIPAEDKYPQLRAGLMRDRSNMSVQDMTPVVKQQLEQSQTEENLANARYRNAYTDLLSSGELKPGKQPAGMNQDGKMIPSPTLLNLNEGKAVSNLLPEVRQALEQNLDLLGPIKGRMGSANPYDTRAQTVDARFRTASQAFGRVMEGGVLRKEDEEKYRKMFPQLSDTKDVARNKLAIVERQLAQKVNSDISALGNSGYDVSGVPQLEVRQSIFNGGPKDGIETKFIGGKPVKVKRLPNGDYEEVR